MGQKAWTSTLIKCRWCSAPPSEKSSGALTPQMPLNFWCHWKETNQGYSLQYVVGGEVICGICGAFEPSVNLRSNLKKMRCCLPLLKQAALLWTQTTKWHCSCQWDSVHCCFCQWHTIVWPQPTTGTATVQWPSSYCPQPMYLSTAQWPSSYSGTGSPEERVTSLGRMSCLA